MFLYQLSISNILQKATSPGLGYGKDKIQTQLNFSAPQYELSANPYLG